MAKWLSHIKQPKYGHLQIRTLTASFFGKPNGGLHLTVDISDFFILTFETHFQTLTFILSLNDYGKFSIDVELLLSEHYKHLDVILNK